jgi:UDP-glucose 4-epimerase
MKKILITGGAGYIGSHAIHYLLDKGFKLQSLIVLDDLSMGNKDSLPPGVNLIKGDLRDETILKYIFSENKIDLVIHFAGAAYVGESMINPTKYFKNNISGGILLLELMVAHDVKKIIFSSSCATYGVPDFGEIQEDSKQMPVNPYGESKLIFEKILNWYDICHGIKNISLRYFNAAGAGFGVGEKHEPETHLIPLVLKSILRNEVFNIYGIDYQTHDGTCVRDFVHVIDIADAHYCAINYLSKINQSNSFNLGSNRGYSVREIIHAAEKITGRKVETKAFPRRYGDPPSLVASGLKASQCLGWKPKYSIDEMISSAWEWERKSQ